MPKNNQKKSQPQSQPQSQTRKAFLLELLKMIGVILVAIVVIVGLFYASWLIKVNNAQGSMKEYLQDKYGKEFKVDRPTLNNGGFGVSGTWSADAYPADNKEDRFSVMKSETRESFADQYTALIWSKRETERINKIAQEGAERWKVDAIVRIYLAEPLSETALPDDSNMEDVIKQDHGLSYTVDLTYHYVSNESTDSVIRDADSVVGSVRARGVRNLNVNYAIEYKDKPVERCSTRYYKSYTYIESVYSYEDIKKCLKKE